MQRNILPLLLLIIAPLPGCVVAAVAGVAYGVVQYEKNEANVELETPVDRVWRASLEGLEARGYERPYGLDNHLAESEDRAEIDGPGYYIKMEERLGGRTMLWVRVGNFDTKENRRKTGLLLESIQARL